MCVRERKNVGACVREGGRHIRRRRGAGIERSFLALSVAHGERECDSRCATQSGSVKL